MLYPDWVLGTNRRAQKALTILSWTTLLVRTTGSPEAIASGGNRLAAAAKYTVRA